MIEVLEDVTRFDAIGEEWDELLAGSPSSSFFLTHDWLRSWWAHLAGRRRLRLLTVREAGRLLAIAPVAIAPPTARMLLPMSRVEFLGTGAVGSDHLDVIVRRDGAADALGEICEYFAATKRMLHLTQVDDGASTVSRLAAALRARGWRSAESSAGVCPFIELSGLTWDGYLAGLGREHRYSFRRKHRALTTRFDVRFEEIASEGRRRETLPVLFELHARRWWRKGTSEAFCTPALRAFHDEMSRRALERGRLRLQILWVDGRPAAAIYGFMHAGTFSFYQSGFDPDFSSRSVGLVAMGLSIRSAIQEGAGRYDLLHGAESYKFHWAGRTRDLRRWTLFPPRARGLVFQAVVAMSAAARRGARGLVSLPATVRGLTKARAAAAGD